MDIRPAPLLFLAMLTICSGMVSFGQTIQGVAAGRMDSPAPFTAIDDSGSNVFFVSTQNIQNLNPSEEPALYRYEVGTTATTRVTPHVIEWAPDGQLVSVSDDGVWVTFISRANPFGTNDDQSPELFVVQSDGSNLDQLTNDSSADSGTVSEARIAGSANRIVFASNADYGSNPQRVNQVFVIDRDGSNLLQLTNGTTHTEKVDVSISDDGTRVVFNHRADLLGTNPELNMELFAIQSDGTGLRQLTSVASGDSSWPQLSGNGARIAFHSDAVLDPDDDDSYFSIYTILWDGTGLDLLVKGVTGEPFPVPASVQYPSITDDAVTIYFTGIQLSSDTTVEKILSDGSASLPTVVYETPYILPGTLAPMISGDGTKISFFNHSFTSGVYEILNVTPQVFVIDSDGSNDVQLTDGEWSDLFPIDLSPDGSTILAHRIRIDQLYNETWIIDSDGSASLVPGTEGATAYSIASNNATILVDQNGLKVMQKDGTGVIPLPLSGFGELSKDGTRVIVVSTQDPVGGNPDGSREVFIMNSDGTGVAQVTNLSSGDLPRARVDASGTWIVFETSGDPAGSNPDGSYEVFRIRSDGTMLSQLSDDAALDSQFPEISSDGMRVIYVSSADPLGTNADQSREIFMFDAVSSTTSQVTQLSSDIDNASLSGNGTWSAFFLQEGVFEVNPDPTRYAYRVNNDTGELRRVDGGRKPPIERPFHYWKPHPFIIIGSDPPPQIDESGDRIALWSHSFALDEDLAGSIHLIDLGNASPIVVRSAAPTVVDWIPVAGAVRYDVIRGNVAQIDLSGAIVDLGPVLCVEDDSPDSDTTDFEDLVDPIPGDAFFYIYRWTPGLSAGPGSWGTSSSGEERQAGSGNCS